MQQRILVCFVASLFLGISATAHSQIPDFSGWVSAWTAGPQQQVDNLSPLVDRTIRAYIPLSVGGEQLRVRFSNEYGTTSLNIGAATVGLTGPDGAILPGTLREISFGGISSILIPVGAPAYSDPVNLDIPDGALVAVNFFLPGEVIPATYNRRSAGLQTVDGQTTGAVISPTGDHTTELLIENSTPSDYLFLTRVDVHQPRVEGVIAVMGTSRTNGPGHWPEYLNRRLNSDGPAYSVINASLQANALTWPYPGGGDAALTRFDRDVLMQPGITHVVIADAINDIGQPGGTVVPASQLPSLENLTSAYYQFLARAKAQGVKVIAATIMPFEGVPFANFYSTEKNRLRESLNQWIRNSGVFDGVIDLDVLMRDPDNPARLKPGMHTDNNFGPNGAGERSIAEAINLELFR